MVKTEDVKLVNSGSSNNQVTEKIPINVISMGTEDKWYKGYKGKGVVVAVLDTGCSLDHEDLSERIVGGYNFTEESNGNKDAFEDLNGHGSHVAGIIAGSMNGSGIVGVAPEATLLILKVLNKNGGGRIRDLVDAVHYAIDWKGPKGERVSVISLSLATKFSDLALYEAIQRAINSQIAVVAASGNDGDGNLDTLEYRFPGSYPEVIEVGAINNLEQVALFSNTNEFVDLYAPGVEIHSTFLSRGFSTLSGTSMATPHVTGALALLIQEYRESLKREPTEPEVYRYLMKHTKVIDVKNTTIRILSLSEGV